jgi:branched-chain amino acid aminotransferase
VKKSSGSKASSGKAHSREDPSNSGELLFYLNGKFVPQSEAKISVFDHGFLYGDGIFEGISVYKGKPFRLQQHVRRLFDSAKTIDLKIPMNEKQISQAILDTIAKNRLIEGYVRPIVTRGIGPLGLNPKYCDRPTIVIISQRTSDYPTMVLRDKPAKAIVSTIRRNPSFCVPASAKTLNYLNNILAKQQANAAGVDEAIMLDWMGQVSEGTGDNLFLIKGGGVLTASLQSSILPGVTRGAVLNACQSLGLKTVESSLSLHDLYTADEAFLTSTSLEIQPLVEIDGRKIGNGLEGRITHRIKNKFDEMKETEES